VGSKNADKDKKRKLKIFYAFRRFAAYSAGRENAIEAIEAIKTFLRI
jgi:hypothetical protein